jgi:peptide/nickel transport system ATP-binding protein
MLDSNLLEIHDLRTYFYQDQGTVKAVDDVSYSIRSGETVGVVGESGCGKSMTAWSVMRLLPSSAKIVSGQILLRRDEGALDLTTIDPEGVTMNFIRGGEIGMIFQEPMTSLSPVHSIGNQLMEAIRNHQDLGKEEIRNQAIEWLGRVGIPRPEVIIDQYAHQLSGGMRQRAMIAIALSCNPSLLIADEPTTAVDVTIQAQILDLMQELQADRGMSIMFITHDMGVIAEMADRVVVMYLGKVAEIGTVDQIFFNPLHPYTRALLKSIPGTGAEHKSRLQTIRGSIPSPYAEITGCPFFARCPSRIPGTCDAQELYTTEEEEGHIVNCFLYEES